MIASKLLLAALIVSQIACLYHIHKHPIETGARCIDGSLAAIYIDREPEYLSDHIVIYFEGGGFCGGNDIASTLESCYRRSKTDLGSSTNYPESLSTDVGIMTNSPNTNPYFWNWTKVFVPYCDGSLHVGSRANPIAYKNTDLYFRGTNNTLTTLQYLQDTLKIYNAKKLVFGGGSAGGIATFLWSNYVYERSVNKQVFSLPDSGIFIMDYIDPFNGRMNLIDQSQSMIKLVTAEVPIPVPQCVADYPSMGECYNAGILAKYLKGPFFIVQSEYDLFCIQNILGLRCTPYLEPSSMVTCNKTEVEAIQTYRKVTLNQSFKNITSNMAQVGFWAPSCIQHGFAHTVSFESDNYKVKGVKLDEALWNFIQNPNSKQNMHIDDVAWPNNQGCSGLTIKGNLQVHEIEE